MQISYKKYALFSGILVAAAIGISGGYLLQTWDQEPSGINSSAAQSDAKAEPNFPIGPGQMAASSPSQVVRADAKSMFVLDASGNLMVDEKTESVLNSLLSILPLNPTPLQRQEVETTARIGLPEKAAEKAANLIRNYIDYRKAASTFAAQPDPENLAAQREMEDRRVALHRRYFDPATAEALFGVRDAQQIYSLEVLRVASDNTLSAAEKQQQIKALHQALPPKIAALEVNGQEFSAELEEQIAALRQRGAPDEEVTHLRIQYFGGEAAPRAIEIKK